MRVSNHNESEEKDEILAGTGLTILIIAFLLYLYEYKEWLEGAQQLFAWILRPEVRYTSIPLNGALYAIIGGFEILVLGTLAAHLLIPYEEHLLIRWLTAFGMGVGLVALLTAILALSQNLYNLWLNLSVIVLILILGTLEHKRWGRRWLIRFADYWRFHPTTMNRWSFLSVGGVAIVVFLIFYHAVLSPIDHWDALIYHTGMAKIIFRYHGISLIAGPSPGIQMSANYPPLYPALGAFFFTHMGTTITDLPLRVMPVFFGIFTLLATYKLGQICLGKKSAILAPLVLAVTPLFILYSIQPLNNIMATCYLTLASLHMVLFHSAHHRIYLVISGLFFGFAISTTYLSLYFIPAFLFGVFLFSEWNVEKGILFFKDFLVSATLTGVFWYLRNLAVLGNPIWPNAYSIFGGAFIEPSMLARTIEGVASVGSFCTFAKQPDPLDWIHFIFFGRVGFPSLCIFTALGASCIVTPSSSRSKGWFILVLTFIPTILMASSPIFFPRYLVLIIPFAAILSSQVLSHVFITDRKSVKLVVMMILTAILIYPGLTAAAMGKAYHDVAGYPSPQPSDELLWYLCHPGVDIMTSLMRQYGAGSTAAMTWLKDKLNQDDKVATFEPRIPYLWDGNLDRVFSLDGWEARYLYEIESPQEIISHLRANKVSLILIPDGNFLEAEPLPLLQFLGSPYFPVIYQKIGAAIYNVGPLPDPILDGEIPAQINYYGWTEVRQVAGRLSRSIVEGDDRPRLSVATPNAAMVSVTYLDEGEGALRVNLYHPYTEKWLFGLATINKTGTGEWRSCTFIVPQDPNRHFTELGLHASGTDFAISQIVATKLNLTGHSSYLAPTRTMSNGTKPSSLMVYLPIMRGGEKLMVNSDSHGKNISIEIFEGIIQPDEVTGWWERHRMIAKSPELPSFGMINPTLSWGAKPGIYTLVIVLWDEYKPDTKIDFSIAIDVESSF